MEITKLGNKVGYSSQYDPTQLEFIPRAPRRKDYTAPMYGVDIWTCYEVSFLTMEGVPQFHVLRIVNPANSENIFESKSLKLYLNSFNNTRFENLSDVIERIKLDLSISVGATVDVVELKTFCYIDNIVGIDFLSLGMTMNEYKYNPNLLEASIWKSSDICKVTFSSDLLKTNCEITNQPDWATVIVSYWSKKELDQKSFLKYIVSYRDHQEFHEPTCERIYNDLYKLLEPEFLTVVCQYTRRGGIDINPIRTTDPTLILKQLPFTLPKRLHQ